MVAALEIASCVRLKSFGCLSTLVPEEVTNMNELYKDKFV
jgi:hypothetical protein